jgi:RHS repeat-associated protein
VTVTDRKSQVTAYTYDRLNRPVTVTYADTSTTANTYDASDRVTEVVDSIGGAITRTWDLRDRLTQETTPEGTVSYTYDAADRRASMTVAGQSSVTYDYDAANQVSSITQGAAVVGFSYDTAGRRSVLALPNGVTTTYSYDAASQLTELSYASGTTTLGNLTYRYDLGGRRTAVGGTWARTGLPNALAAATYDAANQIATWGGTPFSYDPNGNLTNDGTKTYSWNARNQLNALSGGISASFQYDGLGRRRAKTVSGSTTNFLYDGMNFVQEQTGGGIPTANLLTGLGLDETFQRTDATGASTPLIDALGSTLELADALGTLQTHYTYDPFGATTATGAVSTNAAQFTGRENDGTGLYFNRARFYSPALQRFISEDPIGFAGGPNLSSYVANAPTVFVDPLGLKPCSGFGSCAGAGAGQPPPTGPDGKPTPPPVLVPGAPDLEWKWNPDPQNPRGGTWGPKGWNGPNPPNGSWDPNGHWDINPGKGEPVDHYDPQGNPLTPGQVHPGNRQNTQNVIGVLGTLGAGYLIYRATRMVPSLVLPPLWPTIPINAVVP